MDLVPFLLASVDVAAQAAGAPVAASLAREINLAKMSRNIK